MPAALRGKLVRGSRAGGALGTWQARLGMDLGALGGQIHRFSYWRRVDEVNGSRVGGALGTWQARLGTDRGALGGQIHRFSYSATEWS